VPLGKILEDRFTVVTDSSQLQSLCLEPISCALQLHELCFAEGSPISGAEEKQNRALGAFQRVVGLFVTELIG